MRKHYTTSNKKINQSNVFRKIDWEIKAQKLQNRRWKILRKMTNQVDDEFDELY